MRVVSVNVSLPRPITLQGRKVFTGIYKEPVPGRIAVRRHNLDGDAQADLSVHGGEHKAVYAYPLEHYSHWESVLKRPDLPPGTFGENLTTTGLPEDTVCIGDLYRIGSTLLQVTQPRLPCAKLAYKFARPQFTKEFLTSGRSGFYLRVVEEGELEAGDEPVLLERERQQVTVRALLGLVRLREFDRELAARALRIEALSPGWREDVAALLESDPAADSQVQ
jgi:MOSC domain-containing protein YiiM